MLQLDNTWAHLSVPWSRTFSSKGRQSFSFPLSFLAPFPPPPPPFPQRALWKCAVPKNAITFSRGYYWGVGGGTLIWMCLSFTETGVRSLHALRSRAGSMPGVGPAARHGQLLRGSDRWDSHEAKAEAGVMVVQDNKKNLMHFERTKYVNLLLKGQIYIHWKQILSLCSY